ncbi:MAG: ATP-binding protein [Candidatus Omnitrophota bacterium]
MNRRIHSSIYHELSVPAEALPERGFHGREPEMEILMKRVTALKAGCRQNVALTGELFSGKTSILRHLAASLNSDSVIPVYVELGDRSFPAFAERFIATMIYAYFVKTQRPVCEDLSKLIESAADVAPKTAAAARKILIDISRRRYNLAYSELLNITSILKEETQMPCVVILDEFHNIERFRLRRPFVHLGKIIMLQKGTMYVVSSSEKATTRKILSEKLALLFGNFELIEIEGYDAGSAKRFLRRNLGPLEISEYYADYVVSLAERKPFYIDMLGRALTESCRKASCARVNVEMLKDAIAETMYVPTGVLHQQFIGRINSVFDRKDRPGYLKILAVLAECPARLESVAGRLKTDKGVLGGKLHQLAQAGITAKSGVLHYVQDRLFAFWLANVYGRKEYAVVDNDLARARGFREFVEGDIERYLIEYNKGCLGRIADLFRLFRAELIDVDGKLRRFPCFDRVEMLKYGGGKNYVSCEGEKTYWICRVIRGDVCEVDVADFLGRAGDSQRKGLRKILIHLSGIDTNALLLAKEKKIWVWDVKTVNLLLRLYGRYEITAAAQ